MTEKILLVHNKLMSFVQTDWDLLNQNHSVTEMKMNRKEALNLVKIWCMVKKHDLVYCWFSSWHSFISLLFAKLQHKPSILVSGGYDVANLPQINYGHQRGGIKKWISRWGMHLATVMVVNSNFSKQEAMQNAAIPPEHIKVIYHGVADPFGETPSGERLPMAITVGNVDDENRFRKGHEPFIRAAALLPEVQFVLIGAWKDQTYQWYQSFASENVIITGRVSDAVLNDYYCKSSIYVQASEHEGFGLSLAEAMLAGCFPIVANAGAIPEVVGDAGAYLDNNTPQEIARLIKAYFRDEKPQRTGAREQILHNFKLQNRAAALENLIDCLLHDTPN